MDIVLLYSLATLASVVEGLIPSLTSLGNSTLNGANDLVNCPTLVPKTLSFLQLAAKYEHPGEQHQVITIDGYKLTVFRIPGKRKALPILLFHGLADSSDTWIERGRTSLAITLAKEGYDLWFGNVRGNRYSRGHVSSDVESDPAKYWNFTFNEYGKYDLSATIDLVLEHTGAKKLNGFGHSQGTTIYFVLCSTRPEYNDKLNSVTALAPIVYLQNTPPPVSTLIKLTPTFYSLTRTLNIPELFAENSLIVRALKLICPLPVGGYSLCALGIFFPISGYDPVEFGPCFLRVFIRYYPMPTSSKNLYHLAQVGLRKKFAQYDYGASGNEIAYNSSTPPEYDLSKVTTRVVLLVGRNDHLSTIDDVAILRRQLPNVALYRVIPRPTCNHIDFVVGKMHGLADASINYIICSAKALSPAVDSDFLNFCFDAYNHRTFPQPTILPRTTGIAATMLNELKRFHLAESACRIICGDIYYMLLKITPDGDEVLFVDIETTS